MPTIALVAPGPLDARTGGYIYNQRITEGLRRQGWVVNTIQLDASFPCPTAAALQHAARAVADLPHETITLVDSLALGAMPEVITREAPRLTIVALVHQPLVAATGFDPDTHARLEDGERRALRATALVVVTGRAALPFITRYGIPRDQVVIVEPGTDRRDVPDPLGRSDSIELLCVGTVNQGKGHETLLEALASLRDLPWRLTCAGSLTRDPVTAQRVRETVARLRLEDRVTLAGELDGEALDACYGRANVFVLATQQETYGMAVAEAIAHGLPVVATMTGAIPELVGNDAGLLVPVGDSEALAESLARVLSDTDLRVRLAEGARLRRNLLPTWDEACRRMANALNRLCRTNADG
ncbi:MAG: glycosyltransferase family 4 protein [Vicinamibacterales bacterium]